MLTTVGGTAVHTLPTATGQQQRAHPNRCGFHGGRLAGVNRFDIPGVPTRAGATAPADRHGG